MVPTTPRPTQSVTCFPPLTPAQREGALLAIANEISSIDSIIDPTSPQFEAFEWLVFEDDTCPEDALDVLQRYVLAILYFATDGDGWTTCGAIDASCVEAWLSPDDVCLWFGIDCGNGDNVLEIVLLNNNLNGFIPGELAALVNLERLDLDQNDLLTETIPGSLGLLATLRELSLEQDSIAGILPLNLFNARSLERLFLSDNEIEGEIPTQIANLDVLDILEIENNNLVGLLPNTLPESVRFFIVNDNSINGPIPAALADNTNLRAIAIGSNNVTGTIPAFLGNLINLETINLFSNDLTGPIPASLGNLVNLENLFLHFNALTGTMPAAICALNLDQLTADCLPGGPVVCDCCTVCF